MQKERWWRFGTTPIDQNDTVRSSGVKSRYCLDETVVYWTYVYWSVHLNLCEVTTLGREPVYDFERVGLTTLTPWVHDRDLQPKYSLLSTLVVIWHYSSLRVLYSFLPYYFHWRRKSSVRVVTILWDCLRKLIQSFSFYSLCRDHGYEGKTQKETGRERGTRSWRKYKGKGSLK